MSVSKEQSFVKETVLKSTLPSGQLLQPSASQLTTAAFHSESWQPTLRNRRRHSVLGNGRTTLGDSGGQRSLACCSLWPQRVGHNLATEQQQQRGKNREDAFDPIRYPLLFESSLYITSLLQKSCKRVHVFTNWKKSKLHFSFNEKWWKQYSVFVLQQANEPLDRQQQAWHSQAPSLSTALNISFQHQAPLLQTVCGHLCFL